jgi:hypothetical protein
MITRRIRGTDEHFSWDKYGTSTGHITAQRALVRDQIGVYVLTKIAADTGSGYFRRG